MDSNAFKYAAIVAMGGFIFGLDAALISGTVNFISSEFNLSDLQIGMVVSAPGFGVLFALPIASFIADKFGRKKTLQIIALVYIFSAFLSALAPSFEFLIAARFIGGLAFTSVTLASMYIGEIAPTEIRGKLVAMNQINIVVGLSTAYFINYIILQATSSGASWVTNLGIDKNTWRWMLGTEILPAIIWLGFLRTIPRSPRWLMLVSKVEEAKSVMTRLIPHERIELEIQEIQSSIDSQGGDTSILHQLKTLMSPALRTALIIGLVYAIVQQITGINAILFYAPTVFEQLGIGTDAAFMQAVFVGLVSLVFTILALSFIDRIGRRPMTLWGLLWAVLSLLVCAYGFHSASYTLTDDSLATLSHQFDESKLRSIVGVVYDSDKSFKEAIAEVLGSEVARTNSSELLRAAGDIPSTLILFGVLSFIAAFQFSIGPVMWVVFSEIFSTKIRGVAIPTVALATSVTSYLVQQFFPWQLSNMGARDIFLFYAISSAVGLLILFKILPETKGKTIEEIEKSLTRN